MSLPQLPATEELESVNITVLLMLRVIAQSGYANQEEITDSLKLPETEVASRAAICIGTRVGGNQPMEVIV